MAATFKVPTDDLIGHDDTTECVCGPTHLEILTTFPDGTRKVIATTYVHNRLDAGIFT